MSKEQPVFIFEFISNSRLKPATRRVVSLIHETGAIDVRCCEERTIKEIPRHTVAAPFVVIVLVQSPRVVFVSRQPMLPARRSGDQQFAAGQKIVGPGALVEIGRQQWLPVEIPLSLYPCTPVGMPCPQAKQNRRTDLHAHISALESVPVVGVRSLAVGVELVREGVVIKTRPGACQRNKSMCGAEVSTICAEAKLRHGRCAVAGEDLHYAGHGVGAVQRALRSALKFETISLGEWNGAEIERAAGFVYGHSVNQNLVVARVAAAHEQRSEPTTLPGDVDDR